MAGWLIKKNGVSFSSTSDVSLEYTINIGSNGGDSDDVYSVVYTDSNGCVSDELEYRVVSCSSSSNCDCLDIISSSSINFPASGGTITAATKGDCIVTTRGGVPNWISMSSGGGNVTFKARVNSTESSRSGSITLVVDGEDCSTFSLSQDDCSTLPNYFMVTDFDIGCRDGGIRLDVELRKKSDDTLIDFWHYEDIEQSFNISPNPVDNIGVATTYTCSLDGDLFDACDIEWTYRACEDICYETNWKEEEGTRPPGSNIPVSVTTFINSLVIKKGGIDITNECTDVEWYIEYRTIEGTFVNTVNWNELIDVGGHETGEGDCTGYVSTTTDSVESKYMEVSPLSTTLYFQNPVQCASYNKYTVAGSYLMINNIKFKYDGQNYFIMGEGDGSHGCLRI